MVADSLLYFGPAGGLCARINRCHGGKKTGMTFFGVLCVDVVDDVCVVVVVVVVVIVLFVVRWR